VEFAQRIRHIAAQRTTLRENAVAVRVISWGADDQTSPREVTRTLMRPMGEVLVGSVIGRPSVVSQTSD